MRWILTSSWENDVQIELGCGEGETQEDENDVRLTMGDLFDITFAVNNVSLNQTVTLSLPYLPPSRAWSGPTH
jgi:hypothetical protein